MGLRLVLVGMVAILGIDLPSRRDLQDWTQAGHSWLCIELDEWNAWVPGGEALFVAAPPPRSPSTEVDPAGTASPAPAEPTDVITDAEFTAVVEEMIAEFGASDGAIETEAILVAAPAPAPSPVQSEEPASLASAEPEITTTPVTFEPLEVGDDLYPGVAYQLNFASEGTSQIEPSAPVIAGEAEEIVPAAELAATPAPFIAELAPVAEEAPVAEAALAVTAPASEADMATIADEINAVSAPPAAVAEIPPAPAVEPPSHSRNQRLATAFRLTGEAFLAWSKLIEGPTVVSIRP
jgi:hypothetical protein